MNFKSENYTGISSILPQNLKPQDQKPGYILNKILEDFKSCTEIPQEKRPDALFPYQNSQFTLRIPISRLLSSTLSEILNSMLPKLPLALIAIDIVYDKNPSCESVLNLLANLTSYKNFEVAGLITARGFHYTTYSKSIEQWRSFNEGKTYSWTNLVWNICTDASYPVLLVLSNSILKNSPCFLSKIEMDSMQRFCKLQDSRIKTVYTEEVQESALESTVRVVTEKKTEDYFRRSQEFLKFMENREESKKNLKEQSFTPSKALEPKQDLFEYKRNVQEIKKVELKAPENYLGRGRNFSTEPVGVSMPLTRSYKEDLLYKPTRNTSTGLKENSPRPGILKNSGNDSRFSKGSNSSISPLISPREINLSRTLRESNNEKFDDEVTEKPSSILKYTWLGDKRPETVEKKVNFSDNVFKVDSSVKGQMPEIKISATKKNEKIAPRTPDYSSQGVEPRLLIPYKSSEYIVKNELKDGWACPKCSTSVGSCFYECGNCKFINWDKFYLLKSKNAKVRSESIPVKNSEKEEMGKGYRPSYFESRTGAGTWRSSGNEIKVEENYITDEYRKRTVRDYQYNR